MSSCTSRRPAPRVPGEPEMITRPFSSTSGSNAAAAAVAILLFVVTAAAQGPSLDPALLTKPPTDAWPTYHGDYSGRRYSTLKQIDTSTVANLRIEWQYRANISPQGAQTG